MSGQHTENMMDKTIEKIKSMVNADTIIGAPIKIGEVTLIPVSKVTYGFAAGGTDFPSKQGNAEPFGGGAGAGITISPVAFLSICGTQVKMLPVNPPVTTAERIVEMVPDTVDRISTFIQERKQKKEAEAAVQAVGEETLAQQLAEEAAAQIEEKLN